MSGIDQSEFSNIFNTWYEPIRNFLYYKTGDIGVAEDLAQDVFLKIWEKRDEIKIETVKQLLYTIANNLFLNLLDKRKVSMKFVENFKIEPYKENPEFVMEMKEFDNKLQKAINQLDDKQRAVFLMNRIDKYTYNQIADNLSITVKAVEKRMQKALGFLRDKIEMNI